MSDPFPDRLDELELEDSIPDVLDELRPVDPDDLPPQPRALDDIEVDEADAWEQTLPAGDFDEHDR